MEYTKIKRLLDIILALSLTISLSPILLLTAVLIKLDSKGPIIFKQQRLGKNGDLFNIYKFRTMASDNDMYNFKEKDKVTRVGKFLRRSGIDELPQIINILKGEMSFVGPRPQPATYMNFYTEEQKKYLQVLPGILGHNTYTYTKRNIIEKNNIEIQYVDNFSLKQDIEIILTTIKNAPKIFLYRKESAHGNKSIVEEDLERLKNNFIAHTEDKKNIDDENVVRTKPIKYQGEEINIEVINKFKEICKLRYDPLIYKEYFSNVDSVSSFMRLSGIGNNNELKNISVVLGEDWFISFIEHPTHIGILEWVALDKVDNKLIQIKEMVDTIKNILLSTIEKTDIPKIITADMRHDSSYKLYSKALQKGYITSCMDEPFFDCAIPEGMNQKIAELKQQYNTINEYFSDPNKEDNSEYYKFIMHHIQFYASDIFIDKYTRSRKKD